MVFGNSVHTYFGLDGNLMDTEILTKRLREFMENEARSCSMDFGCVTSLYVYKMWGGAVKLEEIEKSFVKLKSYDR